MKRFISLTFICLMILGIFTGCGKKNQKLTILETEYVTEDYAICVAKENTSLLNKINVALAEMEADGTKQAIVDKYISGVDHDLVFQANAAGKPELHMATNAQFPPYEYYENGKIVGIDAEMAAAIADRLDMKLVIDDMDFDAIITSVQTGKADFGMAGMTVTEERLMNINFSDTYATGIQSIIVPEGSSIKSIDDLKAHPEFLIGTQRGTTGDLYAEDDFGSDRVKKHESGAEAVQALGSGKIDCVIIDNEPAKEYVKSHNQRLANSSLKAQFYNNFIKENRWKFITTGLTNTLIITFFALLIGVILGILVAIVRSSYDKNYKEMKKGFPKFIFFIANGICKIYLTVIRGTPIVVQLMIMYYIIFASSRNSLLIAIISFGINSGAYVAEIVRSGIMSIDQGQFEAGRSLGFNYKKTMWFIIIPQAFKNILPALANEFIVLLKETSVAGYVTIRDLTMGGEIIRSVTHEPFLPLIAVALIYLVMVIFFTWLVGILERRLRKNER